MGVAFSGLDKSIFWYPALSLAADQACAIRFGGFTDPLVSKLNEDTPVSIGLSNYLFYNLLY